MPNTDQTRVSMTRRNLIAAGAGGFVAISAGFYPRGASATPDETKKWLGTFGTAPAKEGKITIKAPEIAENGNTVPIVLTVESPMTDQDYVKTIALSADGNPLPGVARFDLSPANGEAHVEFRIRLAQTQKITAVAVMNDGSIWMASRQVKVTIGGCGG